MPKNRLTPHDRYIRSLMGNKKVVKELLQIHLPANIQKSIDWDYIVPQKDSFVDDKLRLQIADVLFKTRFHGEEGFLYLLFEHQSTPDKLMPFRILKYMTAIQEQHLKKEKTKTLPFVYPLILFTGKNKYPYSMDLFTLFGSNEELARDSFSKPWQLIDLSQVPDEELKRWLWFGTMSLVAKHIHDANFLPVLREILSGLREIEKSGEEAYIYATISYIVEAGEVSDRQDFIEAIKQLETVDEGKIMTIAEQLKPEIFKKGLQQGMQQGMEKGILQAARALELLRKNHPLDKIIEDTGLSEAQVKELEKTLH